MNHSGMIYHYGYFRRSKRLKLLSWLILPILVLFAALTFFFFRDELTADHFRYLLRNIEWNPNSVATSGDTIYYNGDSDSTFGYVAGGLACLTDTRVFVTDSRSGTTLSDYHGFRTPQAVFSDKYMLVYDRTGSVLAVYSAFSRLKTLTYDGTVSTAAVADDGTFAVCVAEKGSYYSTVYVYDKNFKQINKLSKYKYVTSLDLSDDGSKLVLASVYTDAQGVLSSEVLLLKVGKTTAEATYTYSGVTALKASFAENESFVLLCDDRTLFFDKKGKEVFCTFYQNAPDNIFCGENSLMLLFSSDDSRRMTLYAYDNAGKSLYTSFPLEGRCHSLNEDADSFYLLLEDALLILPKKGGESERVPMETKGACLINADGSLYLATASVAKRLEMAE